jgi:hypothetical protein
MLNKTFMYIGIDVGGTYTRIAGSPSLKKIRLTDINTFSTDKDFEIGIIEIIKNIKSISNTPKSIGIGMPGKISEDEREFIDSTNLLSWINKSIVTRLEKKFNCFVYLKNDAVAQSLGEVYYGSMQTKKFLYLVWGTGLGGALVTYDENKVVSEKLDRSYLRKWEEKFGGKNIEDRFNKSAKELNDKEWGIVLSEFKNSIQDLSNKFKVSKVIISGGIVNKQKSRISKIISNISSPKIEFSSLENKIGIYGGLAIIKSHLKKE